MHTHLVGGTEWRCNVSECPDTTSKAETQKRADERPFCFKCRNRAKGMNTAGTRHNLGCPERPKKGAEGLGSSGYLIVVPSDSGGPARCPVCYETHPLDLGLCLTCNRKVAFCQCYCDARQDCQHADRHVALNHDVRPAEER